MGRNLLLIHGVIEFLAGVVLILRPDLLLSVEDQSLETIVVAKLYGIAIIFFGIMCYLLYQKFTYNPFYKKIMLLLMTFHLLVAFHMMGAYTQGVAGNAGAFGLHMLLAASFLVAYMKDIGKYAVQDQNKIAD